MSPAATLGYEWQSLSWQKLEQSVCKLPKRSFRAARRPQTTPCVDSREEVSMTGTDQRGAVCGETRTHGFEGERGAAKPLAQPTTPRPHVCYRISIASPNEKNR